MCTGCSCGAALCRVASGTELYKPCKGNGCIWVACLPGMASETAFSILIGLERGFHLPASVE